MVATPDVIAARAGDAQAFARLVRAHCSMVTALATAILGNPVMGEEVGQEVFVAAWQGLPGLQRPDSFVNWLRQMTRNRAQDALRRRFRRKELLDERVLEAVVDPGAETGERMDEARQEKALWTAFEALDTGDREVLALFYRQEGSVRLVAEQLELSEPAVRKRLSRAREKLRDDVQEALGQRLARTAPAGAFVAAVLAMLPRQARAANPRLWQAWVAGAFTTATLGLMLAFQWPGPHPEAPRGPRPSETRSGRASLGKPVRPLPAMASASTEPESAVVVVRLDSWASSDGSVHAIHPFQPGNFWPTPDEVRFPEGEAALAVIERVHTARWSDPVSDELYEELEPLRTAPLRDPWAALVALEAERLAAHHAWASARADAETARLQLSSMLSLALRVRETWPQHPVVDYADLYVLNALGSLEADTVDPDALAGEAMDVLRRRQDPLVMDAAATQLAYVGDRAKVTPEDLDVIAALFDDPRARLPRHDLSVLALESALQARDLQRAASWMPRHHEAVEQHCAEIAASDKREVLPRARRPLELAVGPG